MAKDKIGKLWEDANKAPYTELFNDNVTANIIWRKIQIMRVLDSKLSQKQISTVDREKGTCIYGNRFISHMIFSYVGRSKLFSSDTEFDKYLEKELPEIIDNVINSTLEAVNSEYSNKGVYQVFRKLENYNLLKEKVLQMYSIN